jgi:serine/threonine protein phosphatase PrpC
VTEAGPAMRSAGDSHIGKVRTTNEDALIVEPRLGLYAVLDGMGGASAGDIASQLARDVIREFVHQRRAALPPRELLEAAIVAGSAAVFGESQRHRDRHGMGTTVVACLVADARRVVIGHVGDSRAYLWRDGRLQTLTRDHTIVEELVDRGLLSAEEAERHPYKTTWAPSPRPGSTVWTSSSARATGCCCAPMACTATRRPRRSSTCWDRATPPSTWRAT